MSRHEEGSKSDKKYITVRYNNMTLPLPLDDKCQFIYYMCSGSYESNAGVAGPGVHHIYIHRSITLGYGLRCGLRISISVYRNLTYCVFTVPLTAYKTRTTKLTKEKYIELLFT